MSVQDRLLSDPIDRDLSWMTWYGFGVLTGLRSRTMKTLKVNDNDCSLLQDTVTGRLFLHKSTMGGFIQYWEDDPDQARLFAPGRVIYSSA